MNKFKIYYLLVAIVVASCSAEDGADGLNSLIDLVAEPMGDNCAAGGVAVHSGLDVNANGVLDAEEITDTEYMCNGADGIDGASDKEIRFLLQSNYTFNVIGGTNIVKTDLIEFDISRYPDIDSAVMTIVFQVPDLTVPYDVGLRDLTNDASIQSSFGGFIVDGATNTYQLSSEILIDNFPKEKIDVGIVFLAPNGDNSQFTIFSAYLILYRNK
ncbi:hypothetical protein [Fulvivirga sp.]|uniref:DUF7151 family protein n=1 Tax=Fulvivirga sp. TaxID=1931237 RepID=UPI0032EE0D08